MFLSRRHNEALANLRYGLTGRPGLTLIVGEAGTGKTTLVRAALQPTNHESPDQRVLHLSNPTLTRSEFYEYLATGFGFSAEAAQSKTRFLKELETSLDALGPDEPPVALLVDEAQSLPHELLEEIRLLTNIQTAAGRSLTVGLLGQPELADRLNEDRLRQLKQRVALRCELTPLDLQETAAYIATRIRVSQGKPELLFTRDAISTIYERSRGIPRTINVICDNALVAGFAADCRPVSRDIVTEVCEDFQLEAASTRAPIASPAASPKQPVQARVARSSPPRVPTAHESVTPAAPEVVSQSKSAESGDKSLFATFGRRPRRFFIF